MPRSSKRPPAQLPRLRETWFIATTQLRTWIASPDETPYRPYVVLVLSADKGTVRESQITGAAPTPDEVWETLSKAMREPVMRSGKPGAPQKMIIPDSELAQAILPYLAKAQLETEVYQLPLPDEVMEVVRGLEDHLRGGKPEHPALASVRGVTPDLLGGFYSAAAGYYRAAPWVHLNNYQVIALRIPTDGRGAFRYAMSMGQGGVAYGLAKYLRWEDVVSQFIEDDRPNEMLPPGGLHSLFFGDITQVPFDDVEAIDKFQWEIAGPEAYPIPFVVLGSEEARRPSREELHWYEAALRAIPVIVHDHLKPNGRGDYEPIEMRLDVLTSAGTVAVDVKYPAGEIPLAEQPAQRMMWSEDDESEENAPVFDRRAMEGMMRRAGKRVGARSQWGDPKMERAQDLMYRAFNQGIRYLLLALLLEIGREDEAAELMQAKDYADEWSAVWLYTRALLEFRRRGASARANKALAVALGQNPHVPAYLTGKRRLPSRRPPLIGMGNEDEAIAYASEYLNHWRSTPGAVEWLSAAKPPSKPTRAKARRSPVRSRKKR